MPRYAIRLLLLTASLAAAPAFADATSEARTRDQLRQVVLQLRAAQDENAALRNKLDAANRTLAERPATPAPAPADDAELRALRTELAAQTRRADELAQQMLAAQGIVAQWKSSYEQTVALARARDAEARKFQGMYEQTGGDLESCKSKNAALSALANQLVREYRDKGLWSAVMDKEPVVGLTPLHYEKVAQDYHGKIVEATVPVPPARPAPEPASCAAPRIPDSPSTQAAVESLYD